MSPDTVLHVCKPLYESYCHNQPWILFNHPASPKTVIYEHVGATRGPLFNCPNIFPGITFLTVPT